jgi:RNA polymerase sigma-70 factor (ECF subfamily)
MYFMTTPLKRDLEKLNETDTLLLRQIATDRNTTAMESLYKGYRGRLVPFLTRMTRDQTIIEETYNDVMLTVWNKAEQFQGNSRVSSWIFSIAYRACLNLLNKQILRKKILNGVLFFQHEESTEANEPGTSAKTDLLNKAIKQLPAKQQMVIELSYFQECSIQEIAAIANCPQNTVKTRLHHARQKIRAFMETQQIEVI